ncbi:MAG: hypothetical protein AAF288_00685 [Planctomycetota bacterium]
MAATAPHRLRFGLVPLRPVLGRLTLLIVCAALLSGCQVVSLPGPVGEIDHDIQLAGLWRMPQDGGHITIRHTGPGEFVARLVGHDEIDDDGQVETVYRFRVAATRIDDLRLIQVQQIDPDPDDALDGRWSFIAYKPQGEDPDSPLALVLWPPDFDAFRQACDDGELSERDSEDTGAVHLTSEPDDIAAFFTSQKVAALFNTTDPGVLWRVMEGEHEDFAEEVEEE